MPNLNECLKIAIGNEEYEYKNMYAEFAKTAKKEGFNDIANKFLEVGKIEKTHEEKFNKILTSIKSNDVFKNDKEIY
jgi:rubrerythrin